MAALVHDLEHTYTQQKQALENDSTHQQLQALEKKWAQLEKANFAVREYIQARESEANFRPFVDKVTGLIKVGPLPY